MDKNRYKYFTAEEVINKLKLPILIQSIVFLITSLTQYNMQYFCKEEIEFIHINKICYMYLEHWQMVRWYILCLTEFK